MQVINNKTWAPITIFKTFYIPNKGELILDVDGAQYYEIINVIYPYFKKKCGEIIHLMVEPVSTKNILEK